MSERAHTGPAILLLLTVCLFFFGTPAGVFSGEARALALANRTVDYDVVVYSTQTSGVAAVRQLVLSTPQLRVALISPGWLIESPLAQGLGVEDAKDINKVKGGFYDEWRNAVIAHYQRKGIKPFTRSGRFVYEPEVAAGRLWEFATGFLSGNTEFYSGFWWERATVLAIGMLTSVWKEPASLRLRAKYFIDASVEADLARMLGAHYRVGIDETVYNDIWGPRPVPPSDANGFATAPQRVSALLTLKVHPTAVPRSLSSFTHPGYDPASFAKMSPLSPKVVSAFKQSWSMRTAVLPNSKRELNETWTDWPDVGLAFQWVFSPERRSAIRTRVVERAINQVRYLQENGYPKVGLAAVPQKLYVREGPRIVGHDTYTGADLRGEVVREPVAIGCYTEYDRHDWFPSPGHIDTIRVARMPLGVLLVKGHQWLVVSTAVSTDSLAYSSAVRMEHMRGAMGGAAGAIVAAAHALKAGVDRVPYEVVKNELLAHGYRLEPAR